MSVCQAQADLTQEVTTLLRRWSGGDRVALDQLIPLVYAELRRMARHYMHRESAGRTLQATGLVHEAFLRLSGGEPVDWHNRAQFFGIAAQTMRRILVEQARKRSAAKRGGGAQKVAVAAEPASSALPPSIAQVDVVALDRSLGELAAMDPRRARVVELRFFGGLTEPEIAAVLGISEPTVRRDWSIAKAWLYRNINGQTGD